MRSPALQEHQATMVTPKGLTAAYEDIKGAAAEAIKARLAAPAASRSPLVSTGKEI
jgi:hypothetical protein